MNDLNCLIGAITRVFVKTEFLISRLSFDLKFYDDPMAFFAKSATAKKMTTVCEKLKNSDLDNKGEYISLIEQLNNLRKKRNSIVHGLVLTDISDQNNHLLYHYFYRENEVKENRQEYRTPDLKALHSDIVEIYNALHALHWGRKRTD